jgi:transposase-like protein
MSDKIRRHFTAEQKAAILKEHLLEKTPVSEVCNRHQIAVNLFYLWQKELFENAHLAFAKNGRREQRAEDAKQRRIDALEAKLQRKDGVIAELMEEHVTLKKTLGAA